MQRHFNNFNQPLNVCIACSTMLVMCLTSINARADIEGKLNVDNIFQVYLSTDDNVQGDLLINGNSWPTTYNFSSNITPGQDYYLHIYTQNQSGPSGFLGEFEITSNFHQFNNNDIKLLTDTVNWRVGETSWNNYVVPDAFGSNGVSPWGNRTDVNSEAQWLWLGNNNVSNKALYFSTKIQACSVGALKSSGVRITNGTGTDNAINNTTESLEIFEAWKNAGEPTSGELFTDRKYEIISAGSDIADRIDFGGQNRDFSGTLPYPGIGDKTDQSYNHFLVNATGSISLPAGDYSIFVKTDDGFSLTFDTVTGDDVAFTRISGPSIINSNELRFEKPTANSNTGGSFTLSQDSTFIVSATFFERTGGDYMEISIAEGLQTKFNKNTFEVLKHGALDGKVLFGCSPEVVSAPIVNHYQIIHDGQGLTCDAETITVKACTNNYDGTCSESNEPTDITLKATGTSTVTDVLSFTGSTTASVVYTNAETVVLSLENASIAALNSPVCINGSSTSCNMQFEDAGFRFLDANNTPITSLPNIIAGDTFNLSIQAVENNNGVCEGLFSGNKSVNISQENINPSGISGLTFQINGTDIAKHPNVTSTTLVFGSNSIAPITNAMYQDAGQIKLHGSYNEDGITLTGSTPSFWVSPATLKLEAINGGAALNASSANAAPVHAAGENFEFKVSALNSLGAVTPNYSPGQIQLKLLRMAPALNESVDGALTYAFNNSINSSASAQFQDATLSSFSQGVSSYLNANYSEVGIINVDIQDSNYGVQGHIVNADNINVGRFVPHYFEQTVIDNGGLVNQCGSDFEFYAYSGQRNETNNNIGAITYLNNPIIAVTAYNKQGQITQNYYQDSDGSNNDFMKLDALDFALVSPLLDKVAIGVDSNKLPLQANIQTGTLSQNDLTQLPNIVSLPKGVLHYQLSDGDNYYYNRSANALVAPFNANFDLIISSIIDSDGVIATSVEPVTPSGIEIRFGRMVLENSFGPETHSLAQTARVEHYTENGFATSTDNNCTSVQTSQVTLSEISLSPSLTSVEGLSGRLTKGTFNLIELAPTGQGNQGEIGVTLDTFDWLKYDWDLDGSYDNNPSSKATFGIYSGDSRVLHWRENFE